MQVGKVLKLGILIEDLIEFDEQCRDIVEYYQNISYAMVVNMSGRILFHNNASLHNTMITNNSILEDIRQGKDSVQAYVEKGESYYNVTAPIFSSYGEQIAAIRLGFPKRVISRKVRMLNSYSIFVGFSFLLLAVLFLILFIYMWITKPIHVLMKAIEKIRSNENIVKKRIEVK